MWFKRRDPRIGDELRFHRDRLIDDYMAAGLTRKEAERQAFLKLGNVSHIEEAVRDARGRWLDDAVRDVRYALRALRRSPAFTAVAVLSFALGIGANVAIFSLINGVMLRTLPVKEPGRLVQVTRVLDGGPGSVSYPLFEYFRDTIKSASGAFAQARVNLTIGIDGQEEFVIADLVSANYYTTLGVDRPLAVFSAPLIWPPPRPRCGGQRQLLVPSIRPQSRRHRHAAHRQGSSRHNRRCDAGVLFGHRVGEQARPDVGAESHDADRGAISGLRLQLAESAGEARARRDGRPGQRGSPGRVGSFVQTRRAARPTRSANRFFGSAPPFFRPPTASIRCAITSPSRS